MTTPAPMLAFEWVALVLVTALALGLLGLERWLARRDRLRRRLANATQAGAHVSAGERTAFFVTHEFRNLLRRAVLAFGGMPLLGGSDRERMQALLVKAGWREREAVGTFSTVKMVASLTGLSLGLGLVLLGGFASGSPMLQLAIVLSLSFAGGMVPELVVKRLAAQRLAEIARHLPDAIDLMIISANAGQSLDVSLGRVAQDMAAQSPALGDELQITMAEMRAMPDRRVPLENLARRTELKEVRSVTATLIQTLRYGTPLAQSLKALAREMREARMLRLEERAARLPALLSLPLMLFIMPSVFVVTAGPGMLAIGEALSR